MTETTVYIIESDRGDRDSNADLITAMGYRSRSFASVEEFLGEYEPSGVHCILTDIRMPGMSGIELLEVFRRRGMLVPAVILTLHADTELTVRAMRAGACAVLDKPCREQALWEAVREAIQFHAEQSLAEAEYAELERRFQRLSDEEREVLALIVAGKANKVIAAELVMGLRTVEARRHEVFRKMEADSLAELIRLVLERERRALPVGRATFSPYLLNSSHALPPPHVTTFIGTAAGS